jgi:hypothetical protein
VHQLQAGEWILGSGIKSAFPFGEADFIPGTNHLLGKGIIAAHDFEKQQEWLGVTVDTQSLPDGIAPIFESVLFAPLFARWNVPLKPAPDGTPRILGLARKSGHRFRRL